MWIDGAWNTSFYSSYYETLKLVHKLYHFNYSSWGFEKHVHFIDFNEFNISWQYQPNYINIMREPLDYRISYIYYKFTKKLLVNNTSEMNLEKCIQENLKSTWLSQTCFLAGPHPLCSMEINAKKYNKK